MTRTISTKLLSHLIFLARIQATHRCSVCDLGDEGVQLWEEVLADLLAVESSVRWYGEDGCCKECGAAVSCTGAGCPKCGWTHEQQAEFEHRRGWGLLGLA
jgi:hypothetical protein